MKNSKNILSILIIIIIILSIYIYFKFNEINRVPSCNDPLVIKSVKNVLNDEFKKISILVNSGKPIKFNINNIKEIKTKDLLKNSFFNYGLLSNKIKTCSFDLEINDNKKFPLIFKIYHKSYFDDKIKTFNNIIIYNLYENNELNDLL